MGAWAQRRKRGASSNSTAFPAPIGDDWTFEWNGGEGWTEGDFGTNFPAGCTFVYMRVTTNGGASYTSGIADSAAGIVVAIPDETASDTEIWGQIAWGTSEGPGSDWSPIKVVFIP